MRNELDIIAEKNYAREEGRAEGRAEAVKDTARKMLAKGISAADISDVTGLSEQEIAGLN